MFYHDGKLQYQVEVTTPTPVFAEMLQQAIGGVEGEIRVALQYLFQSWNARGPKKYRDMLLETGTEELAHIEMLATAVALNLEGAASAGKTSRRDMNRKALLAAGAAGLAAAVLFRPRRSWSFAGKVVLITGGSRGLGLLLARQLAAEGARLALVARNAEDLGRAAAELRANVRGQRAEVLELPADVGVQEQIEGAVESAIRHYGRLDVLINNAGIIQVGPAENMALVDFEEALNVHFWGPLHAMRAALPQLKRQGGGRIVNIASIAGKVAVPHLTPYSASKFALVGLSDSLRAELAKDGVQVTTVCPWLVRTGSYRNVALKGRHERELAWFALGDSLPLLSMRGEDAARLILDACRRAAPRLVLTPYGKAATLADALFPQLTAAIMAAADHLLPASVPGGDQRKAGFESLSPLIPSALTRLSDDAAARNNQLNVERRTRATDER